MCVDPRSAHGVDHMLWSRLCSPPTFVQAREAGKGNSSVLLGVLFIRTALATTAKTSPSLFSAISNRVPAPFTLCCCSACYAIFPPLRVSCAFLFEVQNVVDWLQWLTGSTDVSVHHELFTYQSLHHDDNDGSDANMQYDKSLWSHILKIEQVILLHSSTFTTVKCSQPPFPSIPSVLWW